MRLYYQDELVQVWNGDARHLKAIADESIGLVLTSPPWWNGGDYGHDDQIGFGQAYDDFLSSLVLAWKECYRCLQPGRAIIAWMADMAWRSEPVPLVADTHQTFRQAGFVYEGSIYWHAWLLKPMPHPDDCMPLTARPKEQPGVLIIYRKPGGVNPPPAEIVQASRIHPGEYRDSLQAVWTPAPMVNDPYPRLIRLWSYVGDTVLDPFVGQGTVCAYAKQLGRRGIGVELNEVTCAYAAEWLRTIQGPSEHERLVSEAS